MKPPPGWWPRDRRSELDTVRLTEKAGSKWQPKNSRRMETWQRCCQNFDLPRSDPKSQSSDAPKELSGAVVPICLQIWQSSFTDPLRRYYGDRGQGPVSETPPVHRCFRAHRRRGRARMQSRARPNGTHRQLCHSTLSLRSSCRMQPCWEVRR